MAVPTGTKNAQTLGSAGVPITLGDGTTAYAPLVISADSSGTAITPASPGSNMATNQVAVTTSATLVVAARAGRQSVTLSSTSAVVFYVGGSGVTTANGLYVAGTAGASITLNTSAAVYAIGASAVTLSYLESY